MNERNVAALMRALDAAVGEVAQAVLHTNDASAALRVEYFWRIAEALASHGALMASALTDDQAYYGDERAPPDLRVYLERIAKGEAA